MTPICSVMKRRLVPSGGETMLRGAVSPSAATWRLTVASADAGPAPRIPHMRIVSTNGDESHGPKSSS